jgi:S1-C subfamily serine protease/pSer/pThr/pTyr-binding forkhead associated (FHA) protein
MSMKRIVLKHISGSRINQVDEFPVEHFAELTIGRDLNATVRYDPNQDDLVGRQHARIAVDASDPAHFIISDLESRNGTFLNRQRVLGTACLRPGDRVQLGPGGPEFIFEIEPPLASGLPLTREAYQPNTMPPPTREVGQATPSYSARTNFAQAEPQRPTNVAAEPARPYVGKATVERLIQSTQNNARRNLLLVAGGLLLFMLLTSGLVVWWNASRKPLPEAPANVLADLDRLKEKEKTAPLNSAEIVTRYGKAVVFIQVSWKLILNDTGGQVYHQYVQDGNEWKPAYLPNQRGEIEPLLTTDAGKNRNKPIGLSASGSGFIVTSDGFILTNRHVAANWHASYEFNQPGILLHPETGEPIKRIPQGPSNWVPADAVKQRRSLTDKPLIGRNDLLIVTLPETKLPINAELIRVSDEHDVALLKINLPGALPKVDYVDIYGAEQQGMEITAMGYPLGDRLAPVGMTVSNKDATGTSVAFVAQPTATRGILGRIIRNKDEAANLQSFRDGYQHDAATNPGSSGGPLFDSLGRVIGINTAGYLGLQGANLAVPIRYGLDLMGVSQVK